MFGLIGSFVAVAGKRGELIELLLSASESMPGCRSYVVSEDTSDEVTIWVTEVWDDAASHKASLALPAVRAAITKAKPLIERFGEHRTVRPVGGYGEKR